VALPFAPGMFDRVLCVEAIFHFASRGAFFAEAARALVPGGLLVLSDIKIDASADASAVQAGFGPWPDPHALDAEAAAQAAGFVHERTIDATAATRPSHRFTVPDLPLDAAPPDASLRAALALRRLHERGLLRYVYLRYRKAGAPTGGTSPCT